MLDMIKNASQTLRKFSKDKEKYFIKLLKSQWVHADESQSALCI